jgi:cobalamin synthase
LSSLLAATCIVLLLFFAAARGLVFEKMHGLGIVTALPLMAGTLYGCSYLWVRFCERRFGGLTGDTFGAMGELSEILFLAVVSAWLRHSS